MVPLNESQSLRSKYIGHFPASELDIPPSLQVKVQASGLSAEQQAFLARKAAESRSPAPVEVRRGLEWQHVLKCTLGGCSDSDSGRGAALSTQMGALHALAAFF